ncbi:MAG: HD domain-containing protein [Clostridia bacterium]|nr:HD domain-containing protein [Clostridia bacterium]
MEPVKISAMEAGTVVCQFFMIESCTKKNKKTGEPFLSFSLKDKSGRINANYWSPSKGEIGYYAANDIVYVEADVESFSERLQLNVRKIRKKNDNDSVTIQDFVRSSPRSGEVMFGEIMSYIDKYVDNEDLKRLTKAIYEDNRDKLLTFPAAISFHHAGIGGLLEHTIGVMRGVFYIYQGYKYLNKDLLLTGAALHDIGKLFEYNQNETGLLKEQSVDGALVAHLVRGAMLVEQYGRALGCDAAVTELLVHMILAHHGKPEFGSPVTPRTPEAMVLHMIDDMDAKLYEMQDALSKTAENTLTERTKAFDDVRLYRSSLSGIDEQFL